MKPIYFRWTYSPSTGDVTLSHNHEGHPADIKFHSQMASERSEGDLMFGYAYRLDNGWKVTNDKHQPEEDVHIRVAVEKAIEQREITDTKVAVTHHSSENEQGRSYMWFEDEEDYESSS